MRSHLLMLYGDALGLSQNQAAGQSKMGTHEVVIEKQARYDGRVLVFESAYDFCAVA